VLFYALLIYAFFKQLLRAQNVNAGVILVSLCLYLIIGLFWGSLYTLLQRFCGDAFSGVLLEDAGTSVLHLFNYFSIVTLTTLGYGDITPQIPAAASLCQMEAIVGQFYTAVLVAWLVGMYGKPVANEKK
jgi:amino acid transporter